MAWRVDKLDAAAVGRYLDHYLGLYEDASGGAIGPKGVQTLLTDSWEAGVQNWTSAMLAQFRARRGYDPAPWLPVLTGRVVQSAQASERFLFDYRQTLKDLVVDNHYGGRPRRPPGPGMGWPYRGPGDYPRAIADGMTAKARADIPTAEFWYRNFRPSPASRVKADLQEAASAAHCPWQAASRRRVPHRGGDVRSLVVLAGMMKPVADEIFARVGQSASCCMSRIDAAAGRRQARPGPVSAFGQYFNRNETWAEQGRAVGQLSRARTSHMLQQGRQVADVAYFYGEEAQPHRTVQRARSTPTSPPATAMTTSIPKPC
ncbi:glycosyl hydrolase [Caulobacter segnis]